MVNRFRRKFELVTMGCVLFVMVMTIAPINTVIMYKTEQNLDLILNVLAENEGVFPDKFGAQPAPQEGVFGHSFGGTAIMGYVISEETRFRTRYFSVWTDEEGKTTAVDSSHINNITDKDASEQAEFVLSLGKTKGYRGSYKYVVRDTDYGFLVVFLDCYVEQQMKMMLLIISCCIAFLCSAAVILLMRFFSSIAIRPFVENLQNQKRFITDASHELKTPLAIISANADVLELTQGKNEWTDSIKNQTKRMNELIKQLLTLAKFTEQGKNPELTDFSLSDAAIETSDAFLTLAESQGKKLFIDISRGITYKGDEASIRQLVSILLENAVKYTDENGEIHFTLFRHGKAVHIEVSNTCEEIEEENLNRLFERFYRADSSRTRETGGSGIGLSIAKAIVDTHKGRITAKSIDGKVVVFSVVL